MLRLPIILVCLVLLPHGVAGSPEFNAYATNDRLEGPPREPQLTTSWTRKYRTRIREGAAGREGFRKGREHVEMAGPNFAGHYRVVNWGCGSGCLMMVIVDLKTGKVHPPPMSVAQRGEDRIVIPNLGTGWGDFDFRESSRLFVMKTCPWGSSDPRSALYRGSREFCGTSYFIIEPEGFRLIQRVQEDLLPSPE